MPGTIDVWNVDHFPSTGNICHIHYAESVAPDQLSHQPCQTREVLRADCAGTQTDGAT